MRGIGQEALVARIAFVQPGQRALTARTSAAAFPARRPGAVSFRDDRCRCDRPARPPRAIRPACAAPPDGWPAASPRASSTRSATPSSTGPGRPDQRIARRDRTGWPRQHGHAPRPGLDLAHPRRAARRIAQVPAQPRLAHAVQRAANGGEFRRHGPIAQLPPWPSRNTAHRSGCSARRPRRRGVSRSTSAPDASRATASCRISTVFSCDENSTRLPVTNNSHDQDLYAHLRQHQSPDQPPSQRGAASGRRIGKAVRRHDATAWDGRARSR